MQSHSSNFKLVLLLMHYTLQHGYTHHGSTLAFSLQALVPQQTFSLRRNISTVTNTNLNAIHPKRYSHYNNKNHNHKNHIHKNNHNPIHYSNRNIIPSELSVLPNDNQFYDGYEEFIRNLQQDLENDSFDIYYDNNNIHNSDDNREDRIQDDDNEINPKKNGKKISSTSSTKSKRKRNTVSSPPKTTSFTPSTPLPKYKRDKNDDKKLLQPDEYKQITSLIKERSLAQRERNYQKADDILYELNNVHGIYVWDKDRLWSVSAIAPSRRYRNVSDGGGGVNSNSNYVLDTNRFGKNGHDYIQIGDGIDKNICQLELHEIHKLLSKRLEYKLLKQYNKADEIQSQLYDNGVRVHDKLKQWRCDGGIFADVEGLLSDREYTINQFSDPVEDDLLVKAIEDMVREWGMMKKKCNYYEADRIRQVLWDQYRVAVDDKSRTWSYG
jgi:cysteinyl-tRNA synthetase